MQSLYRECNLYIVTEHRNYQPIRQVFMLPTITCVIKGEVVDHVVGFDDMGGEDGKQTLFVCFLSPDC